MVLSRYVEGNGTAFYQMAEQQELEGIVAKRKDSLYIQDKRTKDWIKIKRMLDDDFIICGYIQKQNNMISLVLGKYKDHVIVYEGHVTMGVGTDTLAQLLKLPSGYPPAGTPGGHGNEEAVWVQPKLVGVVKYMPRVGSDERHQSVFKGLRYDKRRKNVCDEIQAPALCHQNLIIGGKYRAGAICCAVRKVTVHF